MRKALPGITTVPLNAKAREPINDCRFSMVMDHVESNRVGGICVDSI